jgi:ring-1,2-phenylacetyl-CoA epoxidase subunit PaaE
MNTLQAHATAGAARAARATCVALAAGADLGALVALLSARLAEDGGCSFGVFYGNYGERSDLAIEALLALKDRYLERLALHFVMEREPEEGELLTGRLDAQKLRALAGALFDPRAVQEYFVTGSGSEVSELHAELCKLGVEPGRIHSARQGYAATASHAADSAAAPAIEPGMTRVAVVMDGRRRTFTMRTGEESILEAGTRAGLDLPFSCRAGVCSTCRTKLVRGEVELVQNYALEDWELAQGFILACQAHAKTAELEITYDET